MTTYQTRAAHILREAREARDQARKQFDRENGKTAFSRQRKRYAAENLEYWTRRVAFLETSRDA